MKPDEKLTSRQKAVYEFIRDRIRNRGYGPTVREIGRAFRIASPNGVVCHLKALEKKGIIKREQNLSRAIRLTREPAQLRGLPLAGQIAAGVLHEAVEQRERVDFSEMLGGAHPCLPTHLSHRDHAVACYPTTPAIIGSSAPRLATPWATMRIQVFCLFCTA